ncbi:hypothetical protein L1049_023905 [Liquidambar formosana]|uniref:Nuclear envelope integral membrane protein 1 n=1 Tax=Liquidambar formosana TaxID=63359 RepID=A0AAP0RV63_LIQFO
MGTPIRIRISAFTLWLLLFAFSIPSFVVSAIEHSLIVGKSTALQLSPGLPVEHSPGSKPGTSVFCERVKICGLSRLKNLKKIAHSLKAKVSLTNSSIRPSSVDVCFHRNLSLGIGMCPKGQWEKLTKGSWVQSMSPFDHKLLDIRMAGSSLETLEVSIEEEFFLYRVIFLVLGIVMMMSASSLSNSLVFYYSSAMAVGVILVILIVLFQGMKILPTGRNNSLAIFMYSSIVGLGSFLLRYLPRLLRSVLVEIGIGEDMYNPLATFLLAFIVLAGAWLGFWVVRKLVLTEDGLIDISTAHFVAWAIRILAAVMILQSSLDPLLAAEALVCGIMVSSIMRRITRSRFLRHLYKNLFRTAQIHHRRSKIPDSSPFEDSHDDYIHNIQSPESSKFFRHRSKPFTLASCNSPVRGSTRTPPRQLSDSDAHYSTFHVTSERRKFSKEEWETFTRVSTKKALEELVSSPDFSKWAVANAERITLTPTKDYTGNRRRRSLLWF